MDWYRRRVVVRRAEGQWPVVVAGLLCAAVMADGVVGFSGVNAVPSWFVGLVVGTTFAVAALISFLLRARVFGWWALFVAAVTTPSTLGYMPNLVLAAWAVTMTVLDLLPFRRRALSAGPAWVPPFPPPPGVQPGGPDGC